MFFIQVMWKEKSQYFLNNTKLRFFVFDLHQANILIQIKLDRETHEVFKHFDLN